MKYNYIRNHLDLEYYNEIYSEERVLLHEKIVDKYFDNTKKSTGRMKIIFTSGAYGCGKSHVLKLLNEHKKIDLSNYIFVNPDNLRCELPEYEELVKCDPWNAGSKTNKEVFYISSLIKYHALFNNYNVIYDSSLKDGEWFSQHFMWLRETFSNIKIIIIHIKADWVNVLERNLIRAEETKRCIPLKYIKEAYKLSDESNNKLKDFADENIIIENNNDNETIKFINENIIRIE
jgi:hypothetical protein